MERLCKNQGRYHGEGVDIDELTREIHRLATSTGWESEDFLTEPGLMLRGYRRGSGRGARRVYLSAGIHGDEPSGPLAIRHLLQEDQWPEGLDIWLVPCLNPTGFRLNTRENANGVDLNREYRNPREVEVRSHIQWLEQQPRFDLTMILHEDWEANGFYVYELNPEGRRSLAEPVIEAMLGVCPVETAGQVDNWPCEGGIIRPGVRPEEREQWPEAVYLIANKSAQSYTLETPSDYPLKTRVQGHLTAVRTVINGMMQRA